MALTNEDREALIDSIYLMLCEHGWGDHYNCGGLGEPMCGKEWAERESISEIFDAVVTPTLARHVAEARAAALNEAVERMRGLLHDPECAMCDEVRDCIAIVRNLAAPPP